MGTRGVELFSDDLATDLRGEFRDLIGEGLTACQATQAMWKSAGANLDDDEQPVFWLALAVTQWKLGRVDPLTRRKALTIIDSETDLRRWDDAGLRSRRQAVLARLKQQLLSPPPAPVTVKKRIKVTADWAIGEVLAYTLQSGRIVLFQVYGHSEDKGGRYAKLELLNWVGRTIPPVERVLHLKGRRDQLYGGTFGIMTWAPRRPADKRRLSSLGVIARQPNKTSRRWVARPTRVDEFLKGHVGLE